MFQRTRDHIRNSKAKQSESNVFFQKRQTVITILHNKIFVEELDPLIATSYIWCKGLFWWNIFKWILYTLFCWNIMKEMYKAFNVFIHGYL